MSAAATSPERVREDLVRLVHRGADVRDFSLGAARILARAVPFDGVCVVTMDPATLLPTGTVLENGPPTDAHPRLKEIEFRGQDFNALRSLALSERHAATLSQATGGVLDRSERHREIMGPNGFGDELRAVLVDDHATWGAVSFLRGSDREPFSAADTALVEAVTAHLAEGLRRAVLLDRDAPGPPDGEDAAGVVVLAPDGSTAFADEVAAAWIRRARRERVGPAGGDRRRDPGADRGGRDRGTTAGSPARACAPRRGAGWSCAARRSGTGPARRSP